MTNRYRPTWAEVNLDYLWHNYQKAASYVPNKVVIPVIKANAYGHGAVEVMKHLYLHGVRFFAVSLLEEALELRQVFDDIDNSNFKPLDFIARKNSQSVTLHARTN